MPNQITDNGLEIKTNTEIIEDIKTDFKSVYGDDINVDSDTPDGQMINIFSQVVTDMLELLVIVYNSFDPDEVSGVTLDQRVAMNGIKRTAGTYTMAPVSITVDRAMTLYGLDQNTETVFTVSDGTGNEFYLETTYSFTGSFPQTQSLSFRAAEIGMVDVLQNTITNQVTITLGVTAVNNPLVATSIGINEETDVQLKIRREKSFMLPSLGASESVRATLLEVENVTDAYVFENDTNSSIGSVPAHSIWAIVENGTDEDVASAIYEKKSAGCGMYGGETYTLSRPNGQTIDVKFDRAIDEDLYIEFTLQGNSPEITFDEDYIKEQLAEQLMYALGQKANSNDIAKILFAIEPDGIYTAIGVSLTDGSYDEGPLSNTDVQHKFVVSIANITIHHPV
jgi:uncharacterized phage protein gp47/JayE